MRCDLERRLGQHGDAQAGGGHPQRGRHVDRFVRDADLQSFLLECVVETDGTIRKATVTRSLDDRFGLDQEAIKAVRAWRFTPGTREGVAVPVWITIELTFSLRK